MMKGFGDILGHEEIREHLQNSLRNHTVSHAYIFSGEDGSGKSMLAGAFAKALECEAGYGDACNMCKSCLQFDTGNHPDIHYVTHDKPNSIGVDEVRSQIARDVIIKPYSSKYKIYIVDEAEKLTEEAQNALLKTIEEPPAYVVILLLTNNISALLPTVRSRCICLELKPVNQDKIRDYLIDRYKIPDYRASVCAAFSQGNVGRAIEAAQSEKFSDINEAVLRLLKNVDKMDVYDMIMAIRDLAGYKDNLYDILDLMEVWYHDVLMLKATNDANMIVYQDEYKYLNQKAIKSSYEGIENIIEAVEKAKVRLRANVNVDTTLELLLLTMKEN